PCHPHPRERTFSFDHSFWSHSPDDNTVGGGSSSSGSAGTDNGGSNFSSQADVHHALGEFLLDNACKGFNCSLFAYGELYSLCRFNTASSLLDVV
ncbi:unnamed protein product, partial [Laminaria digitata]